MSLAWIRDLVPAPNPSCKMIVTKLIEVRNYTLQTKRAFSEIKPCQKSKPGPLQYFSNGSPQIDFYLSYHSLFEVQSPVLEVKNSQPYPILLQFFQSSFFFLYIFIFKEPFWNTKPFGPFSISRCYQRVIMQKLSKNAISNKKIWLFIKQLCTKFIAFKTKTNEWK